VLTDSEKMRFVATSHFDAETLVKNNADEKYSGYGPD
jgi:hypothetical protein